MKDKIIRTVAIATVSIISAALVAYLKNPENRLAVKEAAKKYQAVLQENATKTRDLVNTKIKEFKI